MKIGLYFGSFNPIHIGHLIIAQHVINHVSLDRLWFVVSPQNPFKPSKSLLNEYDRLSLVETAISDNEKMETCDIEFKLPKPSYTIDTLTYLSEKYKSHEFYIVMGSDSYMNIEKWKNSELLLKNYSFIVYQRPGFIVKSKAENALILENSPMLDISASFIRNSILEGKSVRYLLSESVWQEIEKNGYYLT